MALSACIYVSQSFVIVTTELYIIVYGNISDGFHPKSIEVVQASVKHPHGSAVMTKELMQVSCAKFVHSMNSPCALLEHGTIGCTALYSAV